MYTGSLHCASLSGILAGPVFSYFNQQLIKNAAITAAQQVLFHDALFGKLCATRVNEG